MERERSGVLSLLWRLLRSGFGGLAATLADLGTLTLLVQAAGLTPGLASVPALLVGNLVMFFAQKRLAFGAVGAVKHEALRFVLVQAGGFALTAGLYELALRVVPGASGAYVLTRLVVTNLVFLLYSFPLWHWVFGRIAPTQPSD
jgi:putative flippase GtrA